MSDHVTQASLLSRVRDPQNQSAWREFEAKYRDLLLCYAERRGLQPADAEDVRQQVMVNLSRYLRDFKYDPARGRFRSYLGRMVRNGVAQIMTRRKIGEVALDTSVKAAVPGKDEAETDDVWEDEWMKHHYRTAMIAIRQRVEPQTAAIFERFVAGDSAEQIAQAFDISNQAVQKIKQRMRDRMKEQIALQIRDEDEMPED